MEASAPCPYEVKVATEKAHETGLAGRYANAVFELAQEQGLVDVVAADFATLKTAMAAFKAAKSAATASTRPCSWASSNTALA